MIKKNVWDVGPEEIVIIDGERYQWQRDFKKRMPKLGVMLHREMVNIKTGKVALFVRDCEVETEEIPTNKSLNPTSEPPIFYDEHPPEGGYWMAHRTILRQG